MCGLLMRDGFARSSPRPIHLEANLPRPRDIYLHFGFEIDEEHWFGQGSVDERGLRARGKAATGYPEWVMTKVRSRVFQIPPHMLTLSAYVKWNT